MEERRAGIGRGVRSVLDLARESSLTRRPYPPSERGPAPSSAFPHHVLEAWRKEYVPVQQPLHCNSRRFGSPETTKDTKENGASSRSVTPIPSRSVTPKPPDGTENTFRSGTLTIRIFSGKYPPDRRVLPLLVSSAEYWLLVRDLPPLSCVCQDVALPSLQVSPCPM